MPEEICHIYFWSVIYHWDIQFKIYYMWKFHVLHYSKYYSISRLNWKKCLVQNLIFSLDIYLAVLRKGYSF